MANTTNQTPQPAKLVGSAQAAWNTPGKKEEKTNERTQKRESNTAQIYANSYSGGTQAKTFDVWSNDEYKWFTGSDDDERKRIPYAILIEFENRTDVLLQRQLYIHKSALAGESRTTSPNFKDLYEGLYATYPTGRSIRVPYLGKFPFTLQTTYSMIDTKSTDGLSESILKIRTALYDSLTKINDGMRNSLDAFVKGQEGTRDYIRRMANKPETGTEGFQRRFGVVEGAQSIKKWTSAETGEFQTKFTLINDNEAHIKTHYYFIRQIMRAVAPAFPNTMEVRVPYLYEIYIPSQLHLPLGFIGKFTATPKGMMIMHDEKFIVPEAWEIEMTFNSLFPVSKQLLDTIDDPVGSDFGFNVQATASKTNALNGAYNSTFTNGNLTDTESYYNSLKKLMGNLNEYSIPSD